MEDEVGIALRDQQDRDVYATSFRQQWKLMQEKNKLQQAKEDAQEKTAMALLVNGTILIPSEDLEDNMFVVSRGVYEAAKRIESEKAK